MALKSLDYYSKHLKTIGLLTTTKKFGKIFPKGNVKKIMNHLCKSQWVLKMDEAMEVG